MKTKKTLFSFKLITFICLLSFISTNLFAGKDFIGKDTLVYRPYKETVRLTKAQVYDLNSSSSLLFYKPRPFDFIRHVPSDLA